MGDKSGIEWTDATWNPLAGCTPVSAGCRNCYAAGMALRLEAMGQAKYAGTARRAGDGRAVFTGKINLDEAALDIPRRWKRGRRIFVNSMSDLFHKDVPPGFIYQVFKVMAETPQHIYQVLTKRPENIMPAMKLYGIGGATQQAHPWPDNVWIGTSAEDQAAADERIPHLLRVPARVRFLSCEPLLGPVDLTLISDALYDAGMPFSWNKLHQDARGIKWVIVGGESGGHARPMHPSWARSLRDQCQAAGVAFHFKQHGEWVSEAANPHGVPDNSVEPEQCRWLAYDGSTAPVGSGAMRSGDALVYRAGKVKAGRSLDGRTWDELPL